MADGIYVACLAKISYKKSVAKIINVAIWEKELLLLTNIKVEHLNNNTSFILLSYLLSLACIPWIKIKLIVQV